MSTRQFAHWMEAISRSVEHLSVHIDFGGMDWARGAVHGVHTLARIQQLSGIREYFDPLFTDGNCFFSDELTRNEQSRTAGVRHDLGCHFACDCVRYTSDNDHK